MVRFCRLEAWLPVGVAWTCSGGGSEDRISEDEPAAAPTVALLQDVVHCLVVLRQVRPGRGGEPPRRLGQNMLCGDIMSSLSGQPIHRHTPYSHTMPTRDLCHASTSQMRQTSFASRTRTETRAQCEGQGECRRLLGT